MRPDRILLGELRGAEAFAYLRAVNTGHPGSITTVHADSPDGAIDQIAMLALLSGVEMGWAAIQVYARRVIDVVVQLRRANGRRVVSEIVFRPNPSPTAAEDRRLAAQVRPVPRPAGGGSAVLGARPGRRRAGAAGPLRAGWRAPRPGRDRSRCQRASQVGGPVDTPLQPVEAAAQRPLAAGPIHPVHVVPVHVVPAVGGAGEAAGCRDKRGPHPGANAATGIVSARLAMETAARNSLFNANSP